MFIVIEKFDVYFPCICTNEDGLPLIFNTIEEAQEEADKCVDGIIVEYN